MLVVMMKKYAVTLTKTEREELSELLAAGVAPARKLTHARILLKADQSPEAPGWVDERIAEAVETSQPTVSRVRKQYVQEGLEAALNRRAPNREYHRKLDRNPAPVRPRSARSFASTPPPARPRRSRTATPAVPDCKGRGNHRQDRPGTEHPLRAQLDSALPGCELTGRRRFGSATPSHSRLASPSLTHRAGERSVHQSR